MAAAVNSFISSARLYTVTVPYVSVKDDLGRRQMLRRGDIVPPRILVSTIDSLLERGFIRQQVEL